MWSSSGSIGDGKPESDGCFSGLDSVSGTLLLLKVLRFGDFDGNMLRTGGMEVDPEGGLPEIHPEFESW